MEEILSKRSFQSPATSLFRSRLFLFVLLLPSALGTWASVAKANPPQTPERRAPVAILGFADPSIGLRAADALADSLRSSSDLKVLDRDQVRAAAAGAGYVASLNMSLLEARTLGSAIGSDFYVLGDAQTLRRSPSSGAFYFESYASIFVVSSRSGRLLMWERPALEAATPQVAEQKLLADLSGQELGRHILLCIRRAQKDERTERLSAIEIGIPVIETAPEDSATAAAQGLRLPQPFRRLQPMYPETAARAEVEAVVDVLVDLDEKGEVSHVEMARWAGFGLDQATLDTVRQLHFFPAMRNGTPIPLRVLLRYNFRKPPK